MFLRARADATDLIHRLAELRRFHRTIGEGVESLLHLADHGLPDRNGIVALVCHGALHRATTAFLRSACFSPYHTVAMARSTSPPIPLSVRTPSAPRTPLA